MSKGEEIEETREESKYFYLIDQMVDVMFLMVLRVEDEDMLVYLIQDGGGVGVGGGDCN